jgi:hypothetical protein
MKKKRFSVEQMVAVLKQAELGVPVAAVIRKVGISEQTVFPERTLRSRLVRTAEDSLLTIRNL